MTDLGVASGAEVSKDAIERVETASAGSGRGGAAEPDGLPRDRHLAEAPQTLNTQHLSLSVSNQIFKAPKLSGPDRRR